MKKSIVRLLVLAVCMAMVLGMVPSVAFAVEDDYIRNQIEEEIKKNPVGSALVDPQLFAQMRDVGDYNFLENEPNNSLALAPTVHCSLI
jgi:hypothetical protein